MTRGSHKSRSHCQKHEERSFLRFSSKFGSERAVDAVHVRHGRQVALLGHSLSRRTPWSSWRCGGWKGQCIDS